MNPVGFPIGYDSPAIKNNNFVKAPALRQAHTFTDPSICVVAVFRVSARENGVTGGQ
jgi:hypothetical protein